MKYRADKTQLWINNLFKTVKCEGAEQDDEYEPKCSVKQEYVETEEDIKIESVKKEEPNTWSENLTKSNKNIW